ncbi:RidA family protein [Agrobacterium sp. V1]|uniref:RidA family protein n=1 Tax=Agrobacterium sp. V1 TaxID=3061957 RepID=UPI00267110A5|nr:RidA family protein [Agrobacterium sp. V1]MDO3445472.1 RidA family protein [Agrobacterium sp. V1]
MVPDVEFLSPQNLPPTANYSHIAIVSAAARTIYISGQVPLNADGSLVGKNDFEAQAIKVFENMGAALKAADADFNALVKIGLYLSDICELPTLRRVRDEFISTQNAPTSTLVQVSAFFHPDILFEMDAIAVA